MGHVMKTLCTALLLFAAVTPALAAAPAQKAAPTQKAAPAQKADTGLSVTCDIISATVPDEWSIVQAPLKGRDSCNVSFGRVDKSASVSIGLGKADGPRAEEIAMSMARQFGLQERPVYKDGQYHIPFTDEDVTGECVVGDYGANFAVTCLFGDMEIAKAFIKAHVKSTKPDLLPK